MSKWSRRRTKYVSVKVEVGTYARIRQLAGRQGVTRQRMMELLVEAYDSGEVREKVRAVPAGATVIPVTFEES